MMMMMMMMMMMIVVVYLLKATRLELMLMIRLCGCLFIVSQA